MPDADDLPGRILRWEYVAGFPLVIHLTENGVVIGRLFHRTNNEVDLWAELAGIEW